METERLFTKIKSNNIVRRLSTPVALRTSVVLLVNHTVHHNILPPQAMLLEIHLENGKQKQANYSPSLLCSVLVCIFTSDLSCSSDSREDSTYEIRMLGIVCNLLIYLLHKRTGMNVCAGKILVLCWPGEAVSSLAARLPVRHRKPGPVVGAQCRSP